VQGVIRARFATFDDDRLRDYIRLVIAGELLNPTTPSIGRDSGNRVVVGCEDGDVHL